MKRRAGTAIVSALLAALCGCAGCDAVPEDALESCDASQVVPGRVATDILFVIDDSSSMAEEQEKVRHALVRFVQALAASPIPDDFQIGVTNTSVEEFLLPGGGVPVGFQAYASGPSSGVPFPAGALVAVDPENLVSGTASTYGDYFYTAPNFLGPRILTWDSEFLTTDFQNNVLVGTFGSGREQPLRAAQLALTDRVSSGANGGFLRPGARLAIVFVTDEDDCSGPPDASINDDPDCFSAASSGSSSLLRVTDFAAFLNGTIAGETRDVVVAAIAGVTCNAGVCTSGCIGALSAPNRILQLLDLLPPHRRQLASICDANFDAALLGFADAIMSKTLPLDGAPADWRMLVASIERPSVGTVPCAIAPYDAPASSIAAADAIYAPPLSGRPATLTFQRSCALEQGDRVAVQVVCVR